VNTVAGEAGQGASDRDDAAGAAKRKRALVVFEGGGAKGLAHAGAFRALVDAEIEIVGVAGTSAGALMACLVACGLKPKDIVHAPDRTSVLARVGISSAPKLLGPVWYPIKACIVVASQVATFGLFFVLLLLAGLIALICADLLKAWHLILALTVVAAVTAIADRVARRGLASTDRIVEALETLLRDRVARPASDTSPVTFAEIATAGSKAGTTDIPLKVIATNVTTGDLKLFSAEETPDEPVARAVAASMALPVVFRPVMIDGEAYLDGGLVSNLPAWPFDEERDLDPDLVTIAFEISSEPPTRDGASLSWSRLAHAAIFGAHRLNKRANGPMHVITLQTGSVGVLDIDLRWDTLEKLVEAARENVDVALEVRVKELPRLIERECTALGRLLATLLTQLDRTSPVDPSELRVAAYLQEFGWPRTLRPLGMTGGAHWPNHDLNMRLPVDGTFVRDALDGGTIHGTDGGPLAFPNPDERLRVKTHLRPLGLKSCVAIPISHGNTGSLGCVLVDSRSAQLALVRAPAMQRRLMPYVEQRFAHLLRTSESIG